MLHLPRRARAGVAVPLPVTHNELEELLARLCEEHRLPGAAAAFLYDGTVHFATYGTTAAGTGQPVTEDTLFGIGSTSKTLTGTAMMALVERGVVALDDRVGRHLPDLPILDDQARDVVTVGQLLDHTAGWIGDVEADSDWADDALARTVPTLLSKAQQLAPPGTLFSYNNIAVDIAGHLVACLHGTTFEQAIRDLVLEPLKMTHTHYLPWDIANRPHAVGHVTRADEVRPVADWITRRHMAPSGGAFSTARDMMTYARFHLTGETPGRAPISDESRVVMQQQRSVCHSGLDGAGVTWLLRKRGDERLIEHGGNLANLMTSTFTLAPQIGLALSVTGNSAAGTAVGNAVRDVLLEKAAGSHDATAAPMQPQPDLQEYIGLYRAGQWDVEVVQCDGQLDIGIRITDATLLDDAQRQSFESQRTRVVFVAPDLVTPAASPGATVGDFIRDQRGQVQFVRFGGRLAVRRTMSDRTPG